MFFIIFIFLLTLNVSCATPTTELKSENNEELDYFKATLMANEFSLCTFKNEIEIQTPIRKGVLIWNNNDLNLAYEGVFREALRTVWQPLTKHFEINGDGVIVGKKGIAFTIDFGAKLDDFGSLINSYRYKIPETESFGAAFEYLYTKDNSEKIERVFIPPETNTSVQRIWIINKLKWEKGVPIPVKGNFSIILKLNGTIQLTEYEKNDIFVLYSYDAGNNSLKKEKIINSNNEGFVPEAFFYAKEFKEPSAIGTLRNDVDEYSLSSKRPNENEKIVYRNIFTTPHKDITIFESANGINSLTAQISANRKSIFLSWLRQSAKKSTPEMQILTLNDDDLIEKKQPVVEVKQPVAEEKIVKSSKIKKSKKINLPILMAQVTKDTPFTSQVITVPLAYVPSNLKFSTAGKNGDIFLSWWGGIETNQALLMTSLNQLTAAKKNPHTKPKIIAIAPPEDFGMPLNYTLTTSSNMTLSLAFYKKNTEQKKQKQTKVSFCALTEQQFMELTK